MGKRPSSNKKPPFLLPNLLLFGLLRSPKNNADWIHRGYILYYLRRRNTIRKRLYILALAALSPLSILKDLLSWVRRAGREARALSGKSLLRQSLEQLYLAFFYSFDSKTYYMQEFYYKDGLERASNFVHKKALKYGSYRLLGNYGKLLFRERAPISLGDKIEYTKTCERYGLPVVPIYLEFLADGSILDYRSREERRGELPDEDIFCKPKKDHEGEGALAWYYQGDGTYRSPEGAILSREDLKESLLQKAAHHRSGSYIAQPLILPHPKLDPFRNQATPTLRILTFIDREGAMRVDSAMFRFSINATSVIDNANAGGLVAPIHLETGELGAARDSSQEKLGICYSKHPIHGAPVEGARIPYFKEALSLVKEAMALFPHRLVIGWDVLITKEGPLLLEGNSQAGLCFLQRAHRASLGRMEMGEAMAHYTREAIETMYSGRLLCKREDGAHREDIVDLYHGSSMRPWLSLLLLENRVSISLQLSGHLQGLGFMEWLASAAEKRGVETRLVEEREDGAKIALQGRDIDVEDVVWSLWIGPFSRHLEGIEVSWA